VSSNDVVRACPPRGKRVRKGGGLARLCFASWNIGTLTGKSIELVKTLHRRKVNIACFKRLSGREPKLEKSIGINCGIQEVLELEMEWVS